MAMNVEHISPFIEATNSVLEMVCQVKPKLGKLYLKQSPIEGNSVAIILGIVGDIKGQVIFTMDFGTGCYIASKMMMGMPVETLDEMSKSAISELTNMILGNAATLFSNKGVKIDITPPSLLVGEKLQISTVNAQALCIPLEFDNHKMDIEVILKDS